IFSAIGKVKGEFEIHFRGFLAEHHKNWFANLYHPSSQQEVFVHGTVPNDELIFRIAEHDVGFALENSEIKSRDLTITNKMFQYLQGGLAVIATSTKGQREV